MAPTPSQKILRVGLIQGGKIIEERHLKKRDTVTIGQDSRNTFVVPASDLPSSFPVLEYRNNQYSLVFTEQMDGRVRLGGSAEVDFASLRSQNLARKRGSLYVLPLSDNAKGKISLGEVTLLFQFVTPPPEPPKPELPPVAKGSFWQSVDQVFFVVLSASLAIHFSGATWIACQPVPEERELALDELPDRFAKLVMPVKVEPPPQPEVAAGGEEAKTEEKKTEPKKGDNRPAGGADPAAKRAAMERAVASKGLLKLLGSVGGGSGGAFEDVLGSGTGSGDVANALDGAGGVGVATSDALGGGGGPKGAGAGSAVGIGDLGTSGGGNVAYGPKGDVKISGRVQDAAPEVDSTDVDRDALARYVRARKSAIQNCYERELKRNPSLKGKVVVRFSITPQGRASDIEIEENTLGNEAVSSCIRTVIRTWVFPFKPDSDVAVAYPFLFSPAS
ncbi:MAG: AgmX/PglI C-terminal domain-containing protein [Myxococcales bacterium]|nr:AgmX/PglI C-terminal domain-containing protein [Myxococcales bacterium]